MTKRIHYNHCPVCGSPAIRNVLSVKDYTVSGELFPVAECNQCTLRFTQDIPSADSIGPYYKSEDYISHSNTSKGLINRLYQSVRKRTLDVKRDLIIKITGKSKGVLLDIGSGVGSFAFAMKKNGWDVIGIEPDPGARDKARKLYRMELEDIDRFYKLTPGGFDAITLWHVLEHVHDLKGYVSQLEHLLKPGGKAFIAVPNYTSFDASHYRQYWAAYDVPRHLYHFSPDSFRRLIKYYRFHLKEMKPMWFDSFYVSMLSEKYKTGKNNYAKAFSVGMRSNLLTMRNKERCSSVIYILERQP